jgi:holo-[acyl-carrier protein] synthase
MTVESLQELVAELATVDKTGINASSSLRRLLGGSLGQAKLDAALRHKMKVVNPDIYKAKTFGELCQSLGVSAGATAAPTAPISLAPALDTSESSTSAAQIGIDIETIAALPEATDYWEHEFYRSMFTFQEVAYAQLQPQPRETLAGMWCAKEAARKANPAYAGLGSNVLEVVHNAAGQPSLVIAGTPSGALSLSHTSELAVAVFVAAPSVQPMQPETNPDPAPREPESSKPSRSRTTWIAWLALILAMLSLGLNLLRR